MLSEAISEPRSQPYDEHDRVYLTLVAHADKDGLARCSWTVIMDYAGVAKQGDAERIVGDLVADGRLVTEEDNRRRTFRLKGPWRERRQAAQRYFRDNASRVQQLVNQRRELRVSQQKARETQTFAAERPAFNIENLEIVQSKADSKYTKWRFSLRVDSVGTIHDCVYVESDRPFVAGPTKRKAPDEWFDIVRFEVELSTAIRDAVRERITQAP